MTGHQLLDDLADEAPTPGPCFADDLLAAARRRLHRIWAITGASTAAVLVAVGVPVAVQLGRADSSAPPAASQPPTSLARTPVPAPRPPATASIYAAALTEASSNGFSSGTRVRRVDIRASTCSNLQEPMGSHCTDPQPIPVGIQRQVLAAVSVKAPVRFVAAPVTDPPGSTGPRGAVTFVTFGPVEISGRHARVFVQTWCGFDCVRGDGLLLTERGQQWQVTGGYGGYIS